jgi:hypothetical protein
VVTRRAQRKSSHGDHGEEINSESRTPPVTRYQLPVTDIVAFYQPVTLGQTAVTGPAGASITW